LLAGDSPYTTGYTKSIVDKVSYKFTTMTLCKKYGWTIDEAEDISNDDLEMISIIANRQNFLMNKKHGKQ